MEAVEAGIERIVFVVAKGKDALVDYFDRSPALEAHLKKAGKEALLQKVLETANRAEVISIRQGQALGLGHAVLSAKPAVGNEPFAVLLGDDIIASKTPGLKQMMQAQDDVNNAIVALLEVPRDQTNRYGICAGTWLNDRLMQVSHMVEKPHPSQAPSNHAIVGRYILPADIFDILARTKPGKGGEIQLTDSLAELAAASRVTGFVFEGERHDTGNVLGLLRASLHLAQQRDDLKSGLHQIIQELGYHRNQ